MLLHYNNKKKQQNNDNRRDRDSNPVIPVSFQIRYPLHHHGTAKFLRILNASHTLTFTQLLVASYNVTVLDVFGELC